MSIIKKSILILILIIIACAGVELVCNFKVLSLPSEQRGERSLLGNESELTGFEKTEKGYVLTGNYGKIT